MFPKAAKEYRRQITLGLDNDPRAADKARAILRGRFNVAIEDVQALALPVLRHRMGLNFAAHSEGVNCAALVKQLIDTIPTGGELYDGAATTATAG